MYAYLVKGGILMIPILVCSVVALAVFFERVWALRENRVAPRRFADKAEELVRKDNLDEAITYAARIPVEETGTLEVRPIMDLSSMG